MFLIEPRVLNICLQSFLRCFYVYHNIVAGANINIIFFQFQFYVLAFIFSFAIISCSTVQAIGRIILRKSQVQNVCGCVHIYLQNFPAFAAATLEYLPEGILSSRFLQRFPNKLVQKHSEKVFYNILNITYLFRKRHF